MLFSNLHSLLKRGVTLQLIVSAAGGEMIEVTVLPTTEKGSAGAGLVAKTFTATAAELDAEFPSIMQGYSQANTSLKDQLDAVAVMAAEAAKAASEAVAAKSAKPTGATKGRTAAPAKSDPQLTDVDEEDEDAGNGIAGGDVPDASTDGAASTPVPFTL